MTGQAPLLTPPPVAPLPSSPALVESHPQATKEKQAEKEKCLKSLERGGECRKVSGARAVNTKERWRVD